MQAASPPLCQVAFSVLDLKATHRWYQDLFGYRPAGGTRLFFGPLASKIQGLPKASSTCWWLGDQQDYFQLELFQFRSPPVAPLPADYRPCDIGYSMVGMYVTEFEAWLGRAHSLGVQLQTEPVGPLGQRRVCLRDPEGVWLEVLEQDVRRPDAAPRRWPEAGVATRFVRASVADLQKSRRFFVEALGLQEAAELQLHSPEHEALWGLAGAECDSLLLWAGDYLIELVQYRQPSGKPLPADSRISDQGLLNIALGFRSRSALDQVFRRCEQMGYRANSRPVSFGSWAVTYVNDDQGFSVELLFVRPWFDWFMGFVPRKRG